MAALRLRFTETLRARRECARRRRDAASAGARGGARSREARRSRQATHRLRRRGLTAGVDEAGRGPLAGPVVAAAVILRSPAPIRGPRRFEGARRRGARATSPSRSARDALAWGLGWADRDRDRCARTSCRRPCSRCAARSWALHCAPAHVIVDGDRCPDLRGLRVDCSIEAIDRAATPASPAIGAASILAKIARDACMRDLDGVYPGYGLRGAQGLRDARAPRGAAPPRAVPGAPAQLRAGAILRSRAEHAPRRMTALRPPARPHRILARRRRRARRGENKEGHAAREGLIDATARMGMAAVALTDQANLFALVKFYKAALASGRQAADRRRRAGARRRRPRRACRGSCCCARISRGLQQPDAARHARLPRGAGQARPDAVRASLARRGSRPAG